MGSPLSSRPLDLIFFLYFLVHIPITLLFDIQAILPLSSFPQWALWAIGDFLVGILGDPFMRNSPSWFKSFVYCELLLQFPFFFVAMVGLYKESSWLPRPLLVYSTHVLTTLIPITVGFFDRSLVGEEWQSYALLGVYGTWIILPIVMIFRFLLVQNYGEAKVTVKKLQ